MKSNQLTLRPHVPHDGERAVEVGDYKVYAAGTMYRLGEQFDAEDTVLVPLTGEFLDGAFLFGDGYRIVWAALPDYGGVPTNWKEFLVENIIPRLKDGQKLLAFCAGSHGRTGVFLASLIALLETSEETPDPIAAVRQRHCIKAVETLKQAEAVFALRDQPVPEKYRTTLI